MHLLRAGRWPEALERFERAALDQPGDPAALVPLASVLLAMKQPDATAQVYRRILPALGGASDVCLAWAQALLQAGDAVSATDLLTRVCMACAALGDAGGPVAALLEQVGDVDQRCRILEFMHERLADHPGVLRQFATALVDAERIAEARQALARLVRLRPADPFAHVELGRLAIAQGRVEAARQHFLDGLAQVPDYPAALFELAQVDGWRVQTHLLETITSACRRVHEPKALAGLHATLARCLDREGEYLVAARHAGIANTLMSALTPAKRRYLPWRHRDQISAIATQWNDEVVLRLRDAGNADQRLVFVIGLPRSGTTLLERMLAAHPQIAGVGEQSFAVEAMRLALQASGGTPATLTPAVIAHASGRHLARLADRLRRLGLDEAAARIIDKMPDNYLLAGWLRLAFPRASIIHCLRDPRDVAISCWFTQFAEVPWAHSLDHIAGRIEQHRILMRHWRRLPHMDLIELRYEDLITTPEPTLRRVLASIGMDWDPQVLEPATHGGFVGSASRLQVRERLHDRSIGRWRNYRDTLHAVLPRMVAVAAADADELPAHSQSSIER